MNWKRPLALLGVILILAMYLVAIISAFSHNPHSTGWLLAAVFSTVLVPVMIYAIQLAGRALKHKDREQDLHS